MYLQVIVFHASSISNRMRGAIVPMDQGGSSARSGEQEEKDWE
jgi:hypothetical protein